MRAEGINPEQPAALRKSRPAGNVPLRVLSISTLFPNQAQPRHGIFLRQRLSHLARHKNIQLQIMAPVPWFPFRNQVFGRYSVYGRAPSHGESGGVPVHHPRYPVLPKIGMRLAPVLMTVALFPKLLALRKRGFDFDVIDAYYLYPDGVGAALLGMLLKRPVILTAFGTDVSLLPSFTVVRAQILWAVRRAASVTAVCEALRRRLIEVGTPHGKVHVIPHGVDLALFAPPADRALLRRRLGLTRRTLICVGHLISRKGNDVVLSALPHLPETDLLIAGDGPEEARLRKQARKLGVADRVRFLGHVDQTALPEWIGASDALLLCSSREGIANVILEALACGTPAVASPVWGSPEVLRVPEAGLLLKDRTVTSVVEAVESLFARLPDRRATRRYAENFTWSDTASQHGALLAEAVMPPEQYAGFSKPGVFR